MRFTDSLPRKLGAAVIAGLVALAPAAAQPLINPEVGQAGKDVIWVPTADALVEKMLDVAQVTSNDYVIDLGSGDGRTVIAAAKRGARARGIEYEPAMVELSIRNARNAGVEDRAKFEKADLFETDFSQATVLTMFLLPDINLRLRPKILDMKPGTRVVSNSFTMGDWTPDQTFRSPAGCTQYCTAHFWIVPAKVHGNWRLADGELRLEQQFQKISGALISNGVVTPIRNAKLRGDAISFTAGRVTYSGRVRGPVIEGKRTSGRTRGAWSAARV